MFLLFFVVRKFHDHPCFCFLTEFLSFTPLPSISGCLHLGAVWTELPSGAGRVRAAALVLHASSCEAPLHIQSNLPSLMGFAGERECLVRQSAVRALPWATKCSTFFSYPAKHSLFFHFLSCFPPCSVLAARCSPSRHVARLPLSSMARCLFRWRRFMPCQWWMSCSTADSTTPGALADSFKSPGMSERLSQRRLLPKRQTRVEYLEHFCISSSTILSDNVESWAFDNAPTHTILCCKIDANALRNLFLKAKFATPYWME